MDDQDSRQEINKYRKFKKVDGAAYRKVNMFLRKRTYITAREWALARLCTDFRTSGGAEMTFIGQHLPELVPFMEDTYSPQAVNQARNAFKKKVRKSSATFFYGAMCGFFTTDELDDLLFEASEVARFLLEVEGTTLDIDEEIDIEDRITRVMRGVGEAAKTLLKNRGEEESLKEPKNPGLSAIVSETDTPPGESNSSVHSAGPGEAITVPPHTDPKQTSFSPGLDSGPSTEQEKNNGIPAQKMHSNHPESMDNPVTGKTVPDKRDESPGLEEDLSPPAQGTTRENEDL
jgi:hypothetical protein